jgi:hypothetical protein
VCFSEWQKREGPEKTRGVRLRTLTTDAAGELDVLGHDGDTLGVDSGQVGVLEQTHEVGLSSFLEGQDGRRLEAQIGLEVLSNLANQALEGELADQQLGGLLVFTDLTKGHGTGAVAVGLLHTAGCGGGLASGCTADQVGWHRSDRPSYVWHNQTRHVHASSCVELEGDGRASKARNQSSNANRERKELVPESGKHHDHDTG